MLGAVTEELEFKTTVKLESGSFKDAMKDAAMTGEVAIFEMTPTELIVTTSGEKGTNKDSWQVSSAFGELDRALLFEPTNLTRRTRRG